MLSTPKIKKHLFFLCSVQRRLKILHFLLDERSTNILKGTTGKKSFISYYCQHMTHVYHLCTKFRWQSIQIIAASMGLLQFQQRTLKEKQNTLKTHTGRDDLLPLLDFFPITGVPKCSGLVSGSWSSVYMEKGEITRVCSILL